MIARPADYEHNDARDRNQTMDLAGLPVAPGGTFTRDPDTQQVHVRYPRARTCPSGHPTEDAATFCSICGGPLGVPKLGEDWAAGKGDPDKRRDQMNEELHHQRLIEEGVIDPD